MLDRSHKQKKTQAYRFIWPSLLPDLYHFLCFRGSGVKLSECVGRIFPEVKVGDTATRMFEILDVQPVINKNPSLMWCGATVNMKECPREKTMR